ncbi:alpha/beta hydrolase [Streptomyces sp. NPDC060205]|uniref:alpha/beta hydrolase n=1 Tax=Streptomyces sp. NPDC060205 TaxID=3347072 RepID=UPI0036691DC7
MTVPPVPVVFIHGLWLHASSWTPWLDLFRAEGYEPLAPGWPNEPDSVAEARRNPELVAGTSITAATDHFREVIGNLQQDPIIIGHSFGGLIAQKLLGESLGRAAVAIDPAQMKGVLPLPLAQIRSALPAMGNPANLNKAVSLSREAFRYGFGNALPQQESDDLYDKWAVPGPAKPVFQAATANFNPRSQAKVDTANASRGPLLLISGTEDHTVPDVTTRATYKQYRRSSAVTDFKQFDNRGHALTVDSGWKEIAEFVLLWLKEQQL